jgi:hypothetical protein
MPGDRALEIRRKRQGRCSDVEILLSVPGAAGGTVECRAGEASSSAWEMAALVPHRMVAQKLGDGGVLLHDGRLLVRSRYASF